MGKYSKKLARLVVSVAVSLIVLAWLDISSRISAGDGMQPVESGCADSLLIVKEPEGMNGRIIDYTGFRLSFNADCKQPNWVAWELTADEAKANVASRKNTTFMRDPNVEGCATVNDYRGSGFDRGHMCPAADMKWDQRAMNDCFLLTNICPQDNGLNTGAWNALENKCRSWAVRDSAIIIVCGPILTDRLTRHIGDSRVAVPERFFKAVLAPYASPVRAIGFIMPNTRHAPGMQQAAVSIDEIEEATGLDLFSWLPDDIESEVEATCNFPQWNKR